ncbi:putative RNA helicase [Rosa chinensis]|uniref:Putative RNA helicase n=1 Tax=Rosa chinensis TaxID=74649 RepID=A0A2P6QNI1_ROSCH|nr:putative RNA helicase [Rosa chinensis]
MQEKLVANNYHLNRAAKDAYRSYLLAYNTHSMKDIFNVHWLDLQVLVVFLSNENEGLLKSKFISSPWMFQTRKLCGILINCYVMLFVQAVASSFCFSNPPKVNLNLDSSASMFRKNMHRVDGIRHGINPRNPYGRKAKRWR